MAAEVYKTVQSMEPGNLKAERGIQRIRNAQEEARKKLTLAKSLDNYKQRKSAKDFYIETIGLYPRQPDARLALGKIYATDKEYAKAIFEYQSYLSLVPNLPSRERERIESRIRELQDSLSRQQQGRSSSWW
jgi:tetratricopeptide (TPR) repeat protein